MDVTEKVADLKWKWAGHVARRSDNTILELQPKMGHRSLGRPHNR